MRKGSHAFLVIGLIWTAVMLLPAYFCARAYFRQRATDTWTPTPATVVSSELIVKRGSKGSISYKARIAYTYSVNGTPYTSDRRAFGLTFNSSSRTNAEAEVNDHPVGKAISIWVDPENPDTAVRRRGTAPVDLAPAVFLIPGFLGGALFLAFAAWFHIARGPGFVGTKQVLADPLSPGVIRIRNIIVAPFVWGVAFALIASIFSTIVLLVGYREQLTPMILAANALYVLIVGVGVWFLRRSYVLGGAADIVVNQNNATVRVPYPRSKVFTLPLADILDTEIRQDSGYATNKQRHFRVHLIPAAGGENAKSLPVTDIRQLEDVEAFDRVLREAMLLPPRTGSFNEGA